MTAPVRPPARPREGKRPAHRGVSQARAERLRLIHAARGPQPVLADEDARHPDRIRRYFAEAVRRAVARVMDRQGADVLADVLQLSERSVRRLLDDPAPLTDRLLALVWLDPSTDLDERLGDALVAIGRAVVRDRDERRAVPTTVPWATA